jgi:hypothetical protein
MTESAVLAAASATVATLALLFTVASFYWLQARKGRLKLYPVVTFSGYMRRGRFVLRIPVIIFNSGAKPRVVCALRMAATDDVGKAVVLECHSFRKSAGPAEGDYEDMAHAYAVPGRNVVTKHADFTIDELPSFPGGGPVRFEMQAMVDDKTTWQPVGHIDVHTEILYTTDYISYSNNPGVWPTGILRDAAKFRARLFDRPDESEAMAES